MRVTGAKRKLVALGFLAVLAALAWTTLDAGKIRLLVLVVLGGFAVRIALAVERPASDADDEKASQGLL